MVVAIALFPLFNLFSLMIADSIKHIVHALVSGYLLARRMNGLGRQRLWLTFGKAGFAALAMGAVTAWLLPLLVSRLGTSGLLNEVLLVTISGAVSVLAYLGLAFFLRIEELRWLTGLIRQRLKV